MVIFLNSSIIERLRETTKKEFYLLDCEINKAMYFKTLQKCLSAVYLANWTLVGNQDLCSFLLLSGLRVTFLRC